ncbi:YigZ family protein [Luteimonas sp. MC1750]|uniref:IMPACT family protein n=1 Tax=Luteimonas sp. MC1750 TaxID=2799326 RepID=UPI0018F0994F|nr:YigZ family protein [Luteimonas sp. MC1750]MBJ6983166.1 YigZ family protein [Luteimonas sp. MC1750]QQO05130.1 YigZ family protein [Luteimonas sp. MC1750]
MSTITLAATATHELVVKHSRFLASAAPVSDPDAAAAFIASVSVPDATHNCWAWRLGDGYRSSDDGEPAGTAGRPILAAIDGQGLDGVAVVVTRWYGGIKLGAGGLVRAYGGAAAECLRTAERREVVEMTEVDVECPFADLAAVHAALPAFDAEKLSEDFAADGVRFRLRLPAAQLHALATRLRDATRDRARMGDNG